MSKAKSEKMPKFPIVLSGKLHECSKFLLNYGGCSHPATPSPKPMPGHVVKQWAKFLKSSHNKRTLIKFLVTEWKKEKHIFELGGKELLLVVGEQCLKLTSGGC